MNVNNEFRNDWHRSRVTLVLNILISMPCAVISLYQQGCVKTNYSHNSRLMESLAALCV